MHLFTPHNSVQPFFCELPYAPTYAIWLSSPKDNIHKLFWGCCVLSSVFFCFFLCIIYSVLIVSVSFFGPFGDERVFFSFSLCLFKIPASSKFLLKAHGKNMFTWWRHEKHAPCENMHTALYCKKKKKKICLINHNPLSFAGFVKALPGWEAVLHYY